MIIRTEEIRDRAAVCALNEAAFKTRTEADLIETLREQVRPHISLVAEINGSVVGHILFTPVTLQEYPDLKIMGLGPMDVHPGH